jgi:2-phosphosulfolactate phosphatase
MEAKLAGGRSSNSKYSLSPQSFMQIPAGIRVVLPSPNGAALTLKAGKQPTLCGCLRNARAVAWAAQRFGHRIAVIPAGERWSDGSLRPSFEDWVGADAIVSELAGSLSPEAHTAVAAFHTAQPNLEKLLKQCGSGKELIERGFEKDVVLAAKLNVSECVPVFAEGGFIPLQI